jgi:hypothetical protein
VRLEYVHLLEQKRSYPEHHDEESPPYVLVFLHDVKNSKNQIPLRIYCGRQHTFLEEVVGSSR